MPENVTISGHVTTLHRRSLPASLHVVILRHLSTPFLYSLSFQKLNKKQKTLTLPPQSTSKWKQKTHNCFNGSLRIVVLRRRRKRRSPPLRWQGCAVKTARLSLEYVHPSTSSSDPVSGIQPMGALRRRSTSCFWPFIIQRETSRAPSLPARTRETAPSLHTVRPER